MTQSDYLYSHLLNITFRVEKKQHGDNNKQ
jgi:hypothetical protein